MRRVLYRLGLWLMNRYRPPTRLRSISRKDLDDTAVTVTSVRKGTVRGE